MNTWLDIVENLVRIAKVRQSTEETYRKFVAMTGDENSINFALDIKLGILDAQVDELVDALVKHEDNIHLHTKNHKTTSSGDGSILKSEPDSGFKQPNPDLPEL